MTDSWCSPITTQDGKTVFGGAARSVRIAAGGGMDEIIRRVVERAVGEALAMADESVRRTRRTRLRVVNG